MLSLEYLAIAVKLAMLLASVGEAAYCDQGKVEEDEVNKVLSIVNDRRSQVVRGDQQNGHSGSNLPPGKNMNQLYWSCDLENTAAKQLNGQCLENAPAPAPSDKSQIFSKDYFYEGFPQKSISEVLNSFLVIIDNAELSDTGEDVKVSVETLREYANLINPETTEVGCTTTTCSSQEYTEYTIYCLTNQRSLEVGETIYEKGNGGCDSCPRTNTACPSNEGMTDKLRMHFKDTHNFRRSELAFGRIQKNNGNYLPTAGNMFKLEYNCELEAGAIERAKQCPRLKSAQSSRPGIGENFRRIPITEGFPTYRDAIKEVVTRWWNVVRHCSGIGMAAVFREKHVGTAIVSFTQMAWATTRYLGCSIAKCESDYVAVCRYQPRGNIVEENVYKPGTTCTLCTTSCDTNLGLCL
ncbi:unnamed protein product [Cylicocyclus nassatus]|uniref:SCP domain-containing protein n=1 Tax=Cylicocyclus nassatus TaxID=53992 RepID=A0AA36GYT6_CYLNA|nr:unnamed protein product [Cylicocyclus nassatus]